MQSSGILRSLPLFSYGFRPFFLGASIFAGVAVSLWGYLLAGEGGMAWQSSARDWHVHEMLFGFLPAVMTGFLLTAMPNWTNRPPVRGLPLMSLFALWLAGRISIALPWVHPLVLALFDAGFLVVISGIVWWEIAGGKVWDRIPLGILISLYAFANILYHVFFLRNLETDLTERMALGVILILLTLIGGRITPGFTEDFLVAQGRVEQPAPFSRMDALSIILVGVAAVAWIVHPQAAATGWILIAAGIANLVRMLRWYGWLAWREPLVLIFHVGYGWVVISLLIVGGSILAFGLQEVDAVHAVTAGAVGAMTLAVMTRASLGHTGRSKHAGSMTILIYILVNLGSILRLLGPAPGIAKIPILSMAAVCWSGAYMVFAVVYGPMLLQPSLDDQ